MAADRLINIARVVTDPNSTSEQLHAAREGLRSLSPAERAQLHAVSIQAGWSGADVTQRQAIQSIAVKLGQMEQQAMAAESAGLPASRVRREGGILVPNTYRPKAAMRK